MAFLIEYIPSELSVLVSVHAMRFVFVEKSGMLPDSKDSTNSIVGGSVGLCVGGIGLVGDSEIRLGEKVGNSSIWAARSVGLVVGLRVVGGGVGNLVGSSVGRAVGVDVVGPALGRTVGAPVSPRSRQMSSSSHGNWH